MFKGSIVALVTPFTPAGNLDLAALSNLIEWHIQEGTDAIVVCGSTGEAATLSHEEQKAVIRAAVAAAEKRIPIIAGTGTNDTRETVHRTQEAKNLGADACLVIVPYYNRPSQEGCIAHFREIDKAGFAMIPYHNPARTAVRLTPKTIAQICSLSSVVAFKDSSPDIDAAIEIQGLISQPYLSGEDPVNIPLMATGAVGVISPTANVFPKAMKQMVDLCAAGKFSEAMELYRRYYALTKTLYLETNPQCIKYAVHLLGKCHPTVRLPLLEPQESTQRLIREAMLQAGVIESEKAFVSV